MPDEKADLNQLFEIKVLTEGRIEKSIFRVALIIAFELQVEDF